MRFFTSQLLSFLSILATVLTGWFAYSAAYDLNEKGEVPPKRLEAYYFLAVDPLDNVQGGETNFTVEIRSGHERLDKFIYLPSNIRNTGTAPILPSDFIEPFSIETEPPWRIIAVTNHGPSRGIRLRWRRVSDTRFEADPTLMNPGDTAVALTYLTYSGAEPDQSRPPIRWNARIVNLREIQESAENDDSSSEDADEGISTFAGVLLDMTAFFIFFALSLTLLYKIRIMSKPNFYPLIVVIASINYLAAWAGVDYVLIWMGESGYSGDTIKISSIGLNTLLLIVLAVLAIRQSRLPPPAAHPGSSS